MTTIAVQWKSPSATGLCSCVIHVRKRQLARADRHGSGTRIMNDGSNPVVKAECGPKQIIMIRSNGEKWELV